MDTPDRPSIAQQRIAKLEHDNALLRDKLAEVTEDRMKLRHDLKRCEADLAAQRKRYHPNG